MPQSFSHLTVKLNNERIVPTRRFNMAAGPPSNVLRTIAASELKVVEPGMTVAAHPVLSSVPSATSEEAQETLPVIRDDQAGPLYPDRHDENVRWYLPAYDLVKPDDLEAPLLLVRDIGVDEEGERVFAGTLTLSFVKRKPETVSRALEQVRAKIPALEAREIPLAPKEVELRLTYLQDGQERTDTYTAAYDTGRDQGQFELRGGALQLAYTLLAQRDGARVVVIGDFNSWVPVGREKGQKAILAEAVAAMNIKGKAARVEARVRDHRSPKKGIFRRDHRKKSAAGGKGFRFEVEDVFSIKGRGTLATGRLTRGSIRPGTRAVIRSPDGQKRPTAITAISRSKKQVNELHAPAGNTGLLLRGVSPKQVRQGDRLISPGGNGEETAQEQGMAKQRQIVRQERTLRLPCGQFRRAYQFEDEQGQARVFGCEAPWGGEFRHGARYRELGRSELELPDDLRRRVGVYESLDEVAAFLLVPKSYVLARTTDSFAPALSMTTVLDPEEAMESKVVFDFAVAPNLLPFDLWQLKAALATYLQGQMGLDRRPDLRFPTSLATPPGVEWHDPFTHMALLIADGDTYVITVEANSVAEAHAVVKRIKGERQSLNGSLGFELDESLQPSSSLIVDLNRTTGSTLEVELTVDSGFAHLSNRCESPVAINRLLFYREDPLDTRVQPLPQVHQLPPGEKLSVLAPEGTYDGLTADYDIEEDTRGDLSELRVDVSMLEIGIGVDTDLQPHERFQMTAAGPQVALERIHVALDAPGIGQASVTLETGDSTFETDLVFLLVPLDRYLEPASRQLRYRATFAFADGTELEARWLEHNYGQNPNVTVRRQTLLSLLADER